MKFESKNIFSKFRYSFTIVLVVVFLTSTSLIGSWPAKADKEIKPIDIVVGCIDAFFKGDDAKIRNYLTDNAQTTLANLSTNDPAIYNEIRRVILANHPLSKLTDSGIKTENITNASGERQVLLKSANRIFGNIVFKDITEEYISFVEVKIFQNEQEATPLIFQVLLTKNKKKKIWQIASFYNISSGGSVDDFFSAENLTNLRIASNEANIIEMLLKIQSAQSRYLIGPGQGKFGNLVDLRRAGEIDTEIEKGKVSGYMIELIINNAEKPPAFSVYALPIQYNKTGKKSFMIDDSTILHGADRRGDRATPNDPTISSSNDKPEDN